MHIESILGKLSRVVGMMVRLRPLLPYRIKVLVYNTLFFSTLYYCLLVWGTTSRTNLEKIHILQKKFLRVLFNMPYNAHTSDLFPKANIIPVFNLYHYKLSQAFKREVKENLQFLHELSNLTRNTHSYITRCTEQWKVVTPRANYSTQKISYTLPTLLNLFLKSSLDIYITDVRALRQHFVTQSFLNN